MIYAFIRNSSLLIALKGSHYTHFVPVFELCLGVWYPPAIIICVSNVQPKLQLWRTRLTFRTFCLCVVTSRTRMRLCSCWLIIFIVSFEVLQGTQCKFGAQIIAGSSDSAVSLGSVGTLSSFCYCLIIFFSKLCCFDQLTTVIRACFVQQQPSVENLAS